MVEPCSRLSREPPAPRAAARALSRVMAESSAIAPSAFAVSRAACPSAAASRRLRISFSAFRVSIQASRTRTSAGALGEVGERLLSLRPLGFYLRPLGAPARTLLTLPSLPGTRDQRRRRASLLALAAVIFKAVAISA